MKVIYIAGPFRAQTQWQIVENIRAAERIGLMVANNGAMPLIPHANTAHFYGLQTEQFWIDGTLALLSKCDAAVFIPGWGKSAGSRGEWDYCGQRGMLRLNLAEYLDYGEMTMADTVSHFVHRVVHMNYGQKHHSEEHGAAASSAT